MQQSISTQHLQVMKYTAVYDMKCAPKMIHWHSRLQASLLEHSYSDICRLAFLALALAATFSSCECTLSHLIRSRKPADETRVAVQRCAVDRATRPSIQYR